MYDGLLFLHVLAAFLLVGSVVTYSAVVLGAPATPRSVSVANVMWDVGGIATLVFGVWLALRIDGYELWDGWILAALVLWFVATGLGSKARAGMREGRDVASWHWVRTAATVAILVLMVWKPGA